MTGPCERCGHQFNVTSTRPPETKGPVTSTFTNGAVVVCPECLTVNQAVNVDHDTGQIDFAEVVERTVIESPPVRAEIARLAETRDPNPQPNPEPDPGPPPVEYHTRTHPDGFRTTTAVAPQHRLAFTWHTPPSEPLEPVNLLALTLVELWPQLVDQVKANTPFTFNPDGYLMVITVDQGTSPLDGVDTHYQLWCQDVYEQWPWDTHPDVFTEPDTFNTPTVIEIDPTSLQAHRSAVSTTQGDGATRLFDD